MSPPKSAIRRIAIGLATTAACAVVVYQAQLSNGSGTGTKWVVPGLVALIVLVVALPNLILGIEGLRSGRAPDPTEARGEDRMRAFERLSEFLGAVHVFLSLVSGIIGFFLGLFE